MLTATRIPLYMPMGAASLNAPLGGLREDLVTYLGPFIGANKAAGIYDSIMEEIRSQAGTGAKKEVMPLVIGVLAVTGVVAAISVGTIFAVRKRGS